jgi:addiction module RelB/DinJ family antitoxin
MEACRTAHFWTTTPDPSYFRCGCEFATWLGLAPRQNPTGGKESSVGEDVGLLVSDAMRMMLMRVAAEKALPFEVKVPNPVTARTLRKAARGEDWVRPRLRSAGRKFLLSRFVS